MEKEPLIEKGDALATVDGRWAITAEVEDGKLLLQLTTPDGSAQMTINDGGSISFNASHLFPKPHDSGGTAWEVFGCPTCGHSFTLPWEQSEEPMRPYCTHHGNYAWPNASTKRTIENQKKEGREAYTEMVPVVLIKKDLT